MKLSGFYRKAVFYPSLFLLVFTLVSTLLANYKYSWTETRSALLMAVIPTLIYILLMCLFSLTLFFNKIQKVKSMPVLNIASWFLLPVGYIAIVLINDIKNRVAFGFDVGQGLFYILIMTLPFVFGLGVTFKQFQKQNK